MTWNELIKILEDENIKPDEAKQMIFAYKVIRGIVELEKDE